MPLFVDHSNGKIHQPHHWWKSLEGRSDEFSFSAIDLENFVYSNFERRLPKDESKLENAKSLLRMSTGMAEAELSLINNVEELRKEQALLKQLLFNQASAGVNIERKQLITISFYLDTNEPKSIYNAYQAVLDYLTEMGYETVVDFPAKSGSWIKQMISRSKGPLSVGEVDAQFDIPYLASVNETIKTLSEAELNQSAAFLNIIKSLENIPNAVINIHSLIVVKTTNENGVVNIQTRTLNLAELQIIKNQPELLQQSQKIIFELVKGTQ
ncbi:hypothetical protein QFZ20_000783 [Flavobacterium sp. W4I14]|nr:hypothetical protein [Flavobacterium sp. W4I14]